MSLEVDLKLAEISYPSDLPIPDKMPYGWDVGMGMVVTKMNAGNTQVRRRWKHMPHLFDFQFRMTTDQMMKFVQFADVIGADWFNLPSVSMYSGLTGKVTESQPVRFISDLSINADGFNWWVILVRGEIAPEVYLEIGGLITNRWIVSLITTSSISGDTIWAQSPRTPSAPDVYVGGSPSEPATPDVVIPLSAGGQTLSDWYIAQPDLTEFVIAGTPAVPAAVVE